MPLGPTGTPLAGYAAATLRLNEPGDIVPDRVPATGEPFVLLQAACLSASVRQRASCLPPDSTWRHPTSSLAPGLHPCLSNAVILSML